MSASKVQGGGGGRARTPRIEAELAAARRLLESGVSEADEVLNIVAERLRADLDGQAEPLPTPATDTAGAQEERAPAVVRVVVHRARAGA